MNVRINEMNKTKTKLNYQGANYFFSRGTALLLGLRFERIMLTNSGLRIHLTISVLTITFIWTRRYV